MNKLITLRLGPPVSVDCFMINNSEQVVALIKELLALNRTESISAFQAESAEDAERLQSRRLKIRQALVLALSLRHL